MATNEAAGLVVVSRDGRYLSRRMRWVRHRNRRLTSGINRAWVHDPGELRKGGDWAAQASTVYPARYLQDPGSTEITGDVMMFQAFMAKTE